MYLLSLFHVYVTQYNSKSRCSYFIGECRVVTSQKCQLRRYPNMAVDKIMGPLVDAVTRKPIFEHECLDYDGIVMPGETVVKGQVLINRHIPAGGAATLDPGQPIEYKDMPLR